MNESGVHIGICNGQEMCNDLKQSQYGGVSGSRENVGGAQKWFAMSATFGRAVKAKSFLESNGVKCFVPMKYVMVTDRRQGKIRKLVPAISNLIFAYTTRNDIQRLKTSVNYLQYLTKSENGKNVPIVVPEFQMDQFIAVCDTLDEHLVWLAPDEVNLEKGTPVKIVGGQFDGIEGTFVSVSRNRKKKVVVLVKGVVAVMLVELTGGYIQVME